jgi:serine protease Do
LEESMIAQPLSTGRRVAGCILLLLIAAGAPVVLAQGRALRVFDLDNRSYLGIEMEDVTAENMASYKLSAERGVIVRSVEKGSPAEGASLREKDVILEYDGIPVISATQLARLVQETPPGRSVALLISRDGEKLKLTAQIGKREGPGRIFRFPTPEGEPFAFSFPKGEFFAPGRERPTLGVTLQELTPQLGEFLGIPGKKGALITSVQEGSAAASAHLKAGDVIIGADGHAINDPEDLRRHLDGKAEEGKLELKVVREKKEVTVTVQLAGKEERRKGGYRL